MSSADERLAQAKADGEILASMTRTLYTMRCFEVLPHPEGWPMVMRVPGGWIFYMQSGGLNLVVSDDEGERNELIGRGNLIPQFVPYSAEFTTTE